MNHRHLLMFLTVFTVVRAGMDVCYFKDGSSQRCLPPFVNAAFGKTFNVSNTCGTPAEKYCVQTGVTGVTSSCHYCDNEDASLRHDVTFLTDLNNPERSTWWQSSTMVQDVQHPHMVNLTLDLHKAFDITYVRLRFHTSRPESFAIYKKKCPECKWQPFQYYSGSCFTTYGLDNKEIITVENEQKALCTDDFSDISPLTGGNVAFSTLESRPSAYNFDRSPVLQDWVKATSLRISLNRINTFGDEVFGDPNVLMSYYYAISDLSVGARCSCNGHASECYVNANNIMQCRCQHNTAGRDCERCADMFNDRPWSRATRDDPGNCQACDCSGLSETCYFDPELYRETGHGGHCTNCQDFTTGPRCEECLDSYYRNSANRCTACECDSLGSVSQQCNADGQCICKSGVGGQRCDRCLDGFYGLDEAGCRVCGCSEEGTVEGTICNPETGNCVCKLNAEGARCDRCKPSTMNLQESNPYGCTSCFCFGHSAECSVSDQYTVKYILSEFTLGDEGWTGRDFYDNPSSVTFAGQDISMRPDNNYLSYFVAPDKFLGSQRFSYNQMLEFELFVEQLQDVTLDIGSGAEEDEGGVVLPSREDIILEGDGKKVAISITGQGNPFPNGISQLYTFRLHEAAGFQPRLSALDFQKMLNNLDAINIRSTYGERLVGHLDNVQLTSAERNGAGPYADWVESCDLEGYLGDFAGKCAPGFTRDPPNGGPYAPCALCYCNGHSDICDSETGVCECNHNTMGQQCELCIDGYYFDGDDSRRGTPQECQPCPCPQGSACALTFDGSVVCTNCPPGHAGQQCEMCMDGWFGDPRGRGPCLKCMCNGNIDENAIMNCNGTTGECLKCIYNTTGFHCGACLPGYFGNPLSSNPAERCRLCECNHMGSRHSTLCNADNGQCQCLSNVEGRRCDRCRSGFWDLESGDGCETCNCHPIGATTGECDQDSGKCECLPGVAGQRCDRCAPNYYHMTREGCTACDCNVNGSTSLQCTEDGRCSCKEGVLGEKCDRCQDNFYDIANGCVECPACYGLVQDAISSHVTEVERLERLTDNIGEGPSSDAPQGDDAFQDEMERLKDMGRELQKMAEKNEEMKNNLANQTDDVLEVLRGLMERLAGVEDNVDQCASTVEEASDINEDSKNSTAVIRQSLNAAEEKLKQAMMDLAQAQVIADDSLSKENNMSLLADEAEALAAKHTNDASETVDVAQRAYDTSRKAQDSIQEALDILENLMNVLDEMIDSENKIPAARVLRDDLLAQASGVKDNAEAAKNSSTDLFTEANKLTVPSVDTDAMDTSAQNIQTEAEALMPKIEELDGEYKENFGDLEAGVARAKELFNIANAAQKTADRLLAESYAAYRQGVDAVVRGNETYKSVLDTKKSLESFDEEINMNREKAEEALGRVDDIQSQIDLAANTTASATASLGSAQSTAAMANGKAQQAKQIAEDTQAGARNIRDNADSTHVRTREVAESVSLLQEDVANAGEKLEAVESQAKTNASAVDAATEAASSAKATASDSKRRVNAVLRNLNDLLNALNDMTDVDEEDIARYEAQYNQLRTDVDNIGAADILVDLQAEADKQDNILQTYDEDLTGLRKDIANLRLINDVIPKLCSSVPDVEQP